MFPQAQSFQSAPSFQPMASAVRDERTDEENFSKGMEKMFGREIPFDPVVKDVIDKGIKESRWMDPEKRAQVIETAGYLAYDIMIVESLGDHEDAEVAKGAKQAAENCIKKPLKEMNYATVEGTLYVPLSQKKSLRSRSCHLCKIARGSEGGRRKV